MRSHQIRWSGTGATLVLLFRLAVLRPGSFPSNAAAGTAASSSAPRREEDEGRRDRCPCGMLDRPDLWEKARVARWMAHTLDWGVLSTVSSRLPGPEAGSGAAAAVPFGNVYSFVDGKCENSTGAPYFYGTFMDQTFRDIESNPSASFTLSEASLSSVCGANRGGEGGPPACQISPHHGRYGDPESPLCARLTLTGTLRVVDPAQDERAAALDALYERHPQMSKWPSDHDWVVAKLDVRDVWFIDYFGGATVISLDDYFAVDLFAPDKEAEAEGAN